MPALKYLKELIFYLFFECSDYSYIELFLFKVCWPGNMSTSIYKTSKKIFLSLDKRNWSLKGKTGLLYDTVLILLKLMSTI